MVFALILLLIGVALFLDDLHDFVPGTDFLHFLPDFTPIIIAGFQFHHLYIGAILILIALIMMYYA
jgi:hypothetical protein